MAVFVICVALGCSARAEDLKSAIITMLEMDSRMKSANARIEAARMKKNATLGEMLPTVELSSSYGSGEFDWDYPEVESRISTTDTNITTSFDMTTVRLVQPLLFGSQRAVYRKDKIAYLSARVDGSITRQELILNGVTSYLRLKQAEKDVEYARASVENIKKQTEMEDSRVAKGGGVSTDVLQSKAQLLRAQAQLMRAEGQLVGAGNTVERVFSRPVTSISSLQKADLTAGNPIPADLQQAEDVAIKLSPHLKAADLDVQTAEAVVSFKRYENLPKINGVLEYNTMDNYSGVEGIREQNTAKIELRYSFGLGMSSINEARSARQGLVSAEEKVIDIRKQVLQQVRNAWQSLRTAKDTAEVLRNQEAIAEEFLTLARKERTLGRRSLLDVLNGETILINARSEAASAEADIEIYTYQLLRAMGVLNVESDKVAKKSK